ncbi:MAG TPA: ferrochelatase [Vicinamibacterales bacterium]
MSTSIRSTADDRSSSRTVVLLMAHGTPDALDEMEAYLTRVRGGRTPSPELVVEMRHNYTAVGGRSPLTDISRAQVASLQVRLGSQAEVRLGMRTWHPFIAEALSDIRAENTNRVIGIPLAPQYSTFSVQKYVDAATAALPAGLPFTCVRSYHDHPLLVMAFAQRLAEARVRLTPAELESEDVIFTAHSIPARAAEAGDPYADEVAATARRVAAEVGVTGYHLAYQSAGRTPEPWLGPDLASVIRDRAAAGVKRLLVAPIGFVSDHVEILFDLDVQAAGQAQALGVALRRTESLNTLPCFIDLLQALVESQAS